MLKWVPDEPKKKAGCGSIIIFIAFCLFMWYLNEQSDGKTQKKTNKTEQVKQKEEDSPSKANTYSGSSEGENSSEEKAAHEEEKTEEEPAAESEEQQETEPTTEPKEDNDGTGFHFEEVDHVPNGNDL